MATPHAIVITLGGPPDKRMHERIEKAVESDAKALMIGQSFLVLGVLWHRTAQDLAHRLGEAQIAGIKELLVLKLGDDFYAGADKPARGWLTRLVSNPRAF